MRRGYIIAGILVAGLIAIQFFQPEKNHGESSTEADLISFLEVPEDIASVLKTSCYDCHSNKTEYPWYSRIAPVSWYLDRHIREGKEELNFSEFGRMKKSKKVASLSDICEVVESGTMPLNSYLLIHRQARLGEPESEALCNWSEKASMAILKD